MKRSQQPPSDSPQIAPAETGRGYLRSRPALTALLVLILLASTCLVAALYWQLFNPPQASGFLAVGLLSQKVADYSADPRSLGFPPQEASIIKDILQDKDPYAPDLPVRIATLETVLEEPIPTATPLWQGLPPGTATATLPPSASATRTSAPTSSLAATQAGSATDAASPTATPTLTGSPTPTFTVTGKATFTATLTCAPSTSAANNCTPTPTTTAKPSPTPTQTPGVVATVPRTPTATQTAVANKPTFTPTPTATKGLPPTKTPTSTPSATATQPPVAQPTDTDTPVPTDTDTPVPADTDTPVPVVVPTLTTCNSIPANSLSAAADSYVDRTNPGTNFGSDSSLNIRPTAGVDKRALVRFDLSSFAGKKVLAAILYVYNAKGGSYAVSVLKVTSAWDEMSVTWNNQPSADTGSPAGGFQLTNDLCTRGTLLSNALVQGWVDDPGSNYGVMLYPPSGAGEVNLSSREGSNPPQLFVLYQ